MTKQVAKELTLETWIYLAEHPECHSKYLMPSELYKKVFILEKECPLCELFWEQDCTGCPIRSAGQWCVNSNTAYHRWANSTVSNTAQRKEAALRIVEIVSAWEPEEE
jgi:hypothetical protein